MMLSVSQNVYTSHIHSRLEHETVTRSYTFAFDSNWIFLGDSVFIVLMIHIIVIAMETPTPF